MLFLPLTPGQAVLAEEIQEAAFLTEARLDLAVPADLAGAAGFGMLGNFRFCLPIPELAAQFLHSLLFPSERTCS